MQPYWRAFYICILNMSWTYNILHVFFFTTETVKVKRKDRNWPACWCVSQGSSWGALRLGAQADETLQAFPNSWGVLSIIPDGDLQENKSTDSWQQHGAGKQLSFVRQWNRWWDEPSSDRVSGSYYTRVKVPIVAAGIIINMSYNNTAAS